MYDTLFDDDNLHIPRYELIGTDQPSNEIRGGIFEYKVNNVSYLKQGLNFNLSVNGNKCNTILIYR